MSISKPLADLQMALAKRHFPATPAQAGSLDLAYEQIVVALDPSEDLTPRIVQLQHIPIDDGGEAPTPGHVTHYLQCVSVLGIAIKPACLGEVARLILAINKTLEWPGFGLSEKDLAIYLQVVHPCYGALPGHDAVEDILAMMELYLDTFSGTLGQVAQGTVTFAQALSQHAHT